MSSPGASYSTAFSCMILAGAGGYCLKNIENFCRCAISNDLSKCSFIIVIVNSVIGIWRYGNPVYGQAVDKLHKVTTAVQDLVVLPMIVAILMEKYNCHIEMIYGCLAAPVIPLICSIIGTDTLKTDFEKLVTFFGCAGVAYLCYMNNNYYGAATCLSSIIKVFCSDDNSLKIPSQDLRNYAMCFFTYFALKAITD
ncbi:unnamed protein product [Phyllotreta striolata]|uniref:Uncharacterized protein n=1 Tax=Phyllotreta striolata TaxID=444603 RepID=A0A9N9XSI7_PHYSR|nr:unnamed protein product [Phyllotreta striolata]